VFDSRVDVVDVFGGDAGVRDGADAIEPHDVLEDDAALDADAVPEAGVFEPAVVLDDDVALDGDAALDGAVVPEVAVEATVPGAIVVRVGEIALVVGARGGGVVAECASPACADQPARASTARVHGGVWVLAETHSAIEGTSPAVPGSERVVAARAARVPGGAPSPESAAPFHVDAGVPPPSWCR